MPTRVPMCSSHARSDTSHWPSPHCGLISLILVSLRRSFDELDKFLWDGPAASVVTLWLSNITQPSSERRYPQVWPYFNTTYIWSEHIGACPKNGNRWASDSYNFFFNKLPVEQLKAKWDEVHRNPATVLECVHLWIFSVAGLKMKHTLGTQLQSPLQTLEKKKNELLCRTAK